MVCIKRHIRYLLSEMFIISDSFCYFGCNRVFMPVEHCRAFSTTEACRKRLVSEESKENALRNRTIPLVKPLRDILEKMTRRGQFIVGNKDTPYTKSMLVKALKRIRKVLEIDDLHPRMFRYSHATVLHELGIDDKTIQQWEGHASQETTTNFYIKNSQMMSDRAEAALSDFAASKVNLVLTYLTIDDNISIILISKGV